MDKTTPIRLANYNCRKAVEARQAFKANNIYAERQHADPTRGTPDIYVVYSYGEHFPMYVAVVREFGMVHWYCNEDKYSRSTTRHQSQARPMYVHMEDYDTRALKRLIYDCKHPDKASHRDPAWLSAHGM